MMHLQDHWPELTFFELPHTDAVNGIGWSRYWITCLCQHIIPYQQKYAFVLDDSVRFWRGEDTHT